MRSVCPATQASIDGRVRPVRLRRPHDREAEPVGLLGQGEVVRRPCRAPSSRGSTESHMAREPIGAPGVGAAAAGGPAVSFQAWQALGRSGLAVRGSASAR